MGEGLVRILSMCVQSRKKLSSINLSSKEREGCLRTIYLQNHIFQTLLYVNHRNNTFVSMADQPPTMVPSKLNIFYQTLEFSLILEITANLLMCLSSCRLRRDFSLLSEGKTVQPYHPQTSPMVIPSIRHSRRPNTQSYEH